MTLNPIAMATHGYVADDYNMAIATFGYVDIAGSTPTPGFNRMKDRRFIANVGKLMGM